MSHLTVEQRYTIAQMLGQNFTQTQIAAVIGKDKSVVCREIKRNCDQRNGRYNSQLAQRKYDSRLRHKPKKVYFTEQVRLYVEQRLAAKFSPEQIVGVCKELGTPCVSAERIYQHVWSDKKRKGTLYLHLRNQGKRYRKRGHQKDSRGILRDRVSIELRPAVVAEKSRFGDLEIDTVIGKNHQGAILTINDRATGLLRMRKVARKEAQLVKEAAIELLAEFKPYLHTMTADNGKEFALHQQISQALEVDFYFAHPYHSWERGANENLNGLIRQYVPKSSALENLTEEHILFIQEELNNRPRKRFNYKTPNQMFHQKVAFVT
ncbi:IS30 family transposase [Pontibacter beigongshangensis]|uniref:IS30 family transposase n=1 Tax=Pontibacter beigongshangensis TaxID=2574733 RepID=UPI00164F8105|nr:IS30 family transposase [Pontibacter beigongshangensis]